MGGAPLLLALAAVTVDYGWQPDDKGGLEYIVQLPPGQLEQSGEVTSRIDPRVRGLVSRVVIRVGNDRLPRDFGNLAPNSLADISVGAIQQVTETQVRQLKEPAPIVRGQGAGSNFSMPNRLNEVPENRNQTPQGGQNNLRTVGGSRPSTQWTGTGTNQLQTDPNRSSGSLQNYSNNGAISPAPSNNLTTQTTPSTQYAGQSQTPSSQVRTPMGPYRDSSWQSNLNQNQGTRPSTSPYAKTADARSNTNPNYAVDNNQSRSPSSTFANPNLGNREPNSTPPAYTFGNRTADQQTSAGNPNSQPLTNMQGVNSGTNYDPGNNYAQQPGYTQQPGYNTQQAGVYPDNQNLGPLRNQYSTQTNPAVGYPNQTAAGTPGSYSAAPAYQTPSYQPGVGYPSQPGAPSYGNQTPGYNPLQDQRLLIAASGNRYSAAVGEAAANDSASDKAAGMMLAERERLTEKTFELRKEKDDLEKAKEALLYDNSTLIAENQATKDRLQSMSFFQFFLMVSFLANLYLIVHLSKLYQRYRDLVTTVRSSAATAQPV